MRDRMELDRNSNARPIAWSTALAAMTLAAACGTTAPPPAAAPHAAPIQQIAPLPVSAAQRARLTRSTTYTRLRGAPKDTAPFEPGNGHLTHPTRPQVVYASPGGAPVGILPTTSVGGPVWVPIVEEQPGWVRVMLPSRPNLSTGWIYTAGGGLRNAYSPYYVRIDLAAHQLTVFKSDRSLGTWKVATGSPSTPTPTGRTFLLASLTPEDATYSPRMLALGSHSAVLQTFDGGPGTIGLHGWPDESVFGQEVSHGCVRVPAAALRVLAHVPLGSAVVINP
ncbi:L,D-transpeptidase [Nonomuraea sp. NPDC048901]|uniref:L,D-transpeptidase n=1 Tax=Nonomuraea sp. NPDC048901 TaxID=3155627 RepID=UPI0033F36E25